MNLVLGACSGKAWIVIQILYIRIQNSAKFGYKAIIIFNCFNSYIYRDPTGRPNQYVTAIQAVGEIIQVCKGKENLFDKVKFCAALVEIKKAFLFQLSIIFGRIPILFWINNFLFSGL
jgi:hypothetical protein